MNCEQFSSLLELYDGGGLNEAEKAEMNAHAKTCARCQMLLDLRALQAGEEEVPQSAKNAWRAAVQNEEAAHMDVQKKKAPAWRFFLAGRIDARRDSDGSLNALAAANRPWGRAGGRRQPGPTASPYRLLDRGLDATYWAAITTRVHPRRRAKPHA